MIDDTEEHGISNPFTTKLSSELQALKEQQAHSLAPRSGQSRILRKARQKMAEEAQKKVEKSVGFSGLHPMVMSKEGLLNGTEVKDRRKVGQAGIVAAYEAGLWGQWCGGALLTESALTKLLCHLPGAAEGKHYICEGLRQRTHQT